MSKFTKNQEVIVGLWLAILVGLAFGAVIGKVMLYVDEIFGLGTGLFIPIGLGFLALCLYTYKNWDK